MNRLDTTQLERQTRSSEGLVNGLIWGTFGIVAAGLGLAVWLGTERAHNPTDQIFSSLAWLPVGMLVVDLWILSVVILRREAPTPLRVPYKTPLILGAIHMLSGALAVRLVSFKTLYEMVWVDEHLGHYEVRWAIAATILLLALAAFLLMFFEVRLVRWVLLSEITSAATVTEFRDDESEDLELGTEHIYEAQVLLNNLGYPVTPITGELNASTVESISQFQASIGLELSGRLTAKTMIDLRNRWREAEGESSSLMAVLEHAFKRTGSRIASLFRCS